MSNSRFVVQDSKLLPAFILAPLTGLSALWFCLVAYDLLHQQFAPFRELLVLPWIFMFGLPLCILAEALVAYPIVRGFQRYQWRWLNGWSACAIGFLVGALPSSALIALECSNSIPAHSTWADILSLPVACGVAGLVGAFVFQAIAVQRGP